MRLSCVVAFLLWKRATDNTLVFHCHTMNDIQKGYVNVMQIQCCCAKLKKSGDLEERPKYLRDYSAIKLAINLIKAQHNSR